MNWGAMPQQLNAEAQMKTNASTSLFLITTKASIDIEKGNCF